MKPAVCLLAILLLLASCASPKPATSIVEFVGPDRFTHFSGNTNDLVAFIQDEVAATLPRDYHLIMRITDIDDRPGILTVEYSLVDASCKVVVSGNDKLGPPDSLRAWIQKLTPR